MRNELLAQRGKDLYRELYVQIMAGSNDVYIYQVLKELREILNEIEVNINRLHMVGMSDLKRLAEREAMCYVQDKD